jgi:hypothetical protein
LPPPSPPDLFLDAGPFHFVVGHEVSEAFELLQQNLAWVALGLAGLAYCLIQSGCMRAPSQDRRFVRLQDEPAEAQVNATRTARAIPAPRGSSTALSLPMEDKAALRHANIAPTLPMSAEGKEALRIAKISLHVSNTAHQRCATLEEQAALAAQESAAAGAAQEAEERRLAWISHHIKLGELEQAKALGWNGRFDAKGTALASPRPSISMLPPDNWPPPQAAAASLQLKYNATVPTSRMQPARAAPPPPPRRTTPPGLSVPALPPPRAGSPGYGAAYPGSPKASPPLQDGVSTLAAFPLSQVSLRRKGSSCDETSSQGSYTSSRGSVRSSYSRCESSGITPFEVGDTVAHDDHGPGKVMSLANGKTWVKYDSGALRRYAPPITRKLKLAEVAAPQQRPDEAIVMQLISMGFSENASMRAALAIDNSSPDEAAEWVFAHIEDPDINDPLD